MCRNDPVHLQESKVSEAKHRSTTVIPSNVLELMESVGPTRAAKLLGVSTTTLYSARTRGYVSKVIEIAAEGALRQPVKRIVGTSHEPKPAAEPKPEATVVCLIEVGKSKLHVIENVAKMIGAPLLTN